MARDIRSYDSEQDIRNAWKVGGHTCSMSAADAVPAAAQAHDAQPVGGGHTGPGCM